MSDKKSLGILPALLICSGCFVFMNGQSQGQDEILVIDGGTLIDGTGSPPKEDVTILIKNGRIADVGTEVEIPVESSARIIEARGKFIIPGLTDSHVHYFGYEGELYLAYGVTTVMSLGGIPEWDKAQAAAIAHENVVGPRIFTAGNPLGAPLTGGTFPHVLPVRSSEEAIRLVQMEVEKGVDYIKIYRAIPSVELVRAIADEAHRAGRKVVAHLGSSVDARAAALAGVDLLAHASGVPIATIEDPRLKEQIDQVPSVGSAGPASLMQPQMFPDLIQLLVANDVYLEPDLLIAGRGFHRLSSKFLWEETVLLSDDGLSYVSNNARRRWFHFPVFANPQDRETIEVLRKGFDNLTLFLRQFVQAGGKLLAGTDAEARHPPGISLHHELELLVDSGVLSPMQAILAATRYPAEFLGHSHELGSVERNKIADLVVLNRNPLLDISNTRDIALVLKEGKVIDRTYRRYFDNPLPRPWTSGGGRNPKPVIESFPPAVFCGNSAVTVTISGKGFMRTSFVRIDGVGQDIQFVSPTEIKTLLDCRNWDSPETLSLVVVNPEPIHEDESNISNVVRFVATK